MIHIYHITKDNIRSYFKSMMFKINGITFVILTYLVVQSIVALLTGPKIVVSITTQD